MRTTTLWRRALGLADAVWFGAAGRWCRLAVGETLESLFPAQCIGCAAPGELLCPPCDQAAARALARATVVDDLSALDVLAPPSPAPIVSSGRYAGVVASLILEAKRPHGRPLLRRLAPVLARSLAAVPASVLLVPVPAGLAAGRRRGFVPMHEVLRGALGPPCLPRTVHPDGAGTAADGPRWSDVLRRRAWPGRCSGGGLQLPWPRPGQGAQKARGRRERARAVRGVFALRHGPLLRGLDVVLVDDVMTTGATLAECARVLRRGGARVLGAVVISHVPDPHAALADG